MTSPGQGLVTGAASPADQASALHAQWAKIIRAAMADRGITQTDLTRRFGVAHSTVSQVLSGRNRPSLETMAKYADAVGVQLGIVQTDPCPTCARTRPNCR